MQRKKESLSFNQQYNINHWPEQKQQISAPTPKFERDTAVWLPSEFGDFNLLSYRNTTDGTVHLAIVKGLVASKRKVPLRIHSSCVTGDILGSLRCDCRRQLIKALKYIEKKKIGIVIYAFQEGRGIGLVNKLRAYYLQERGLDTVDANLALGLPDDMRNYSFVQYILDDLEVQSVALMTNNPDKIIQLKNLGILVEAVIHHEIQPCATNQSYLETKKIRMGHKLTLV